MTWKFIAIFAITAYLFTTFVFPRIVAFNYEVKNVTLVLKGCDSETCHLTGTWTNDTLTLENLLTKANGEVIRFNIDQVQFLNVPVQQN